MGFNWTNPNDYVTSAISAVTGFFDGSFRAPNTSYCRSSLNNMTKAFTNFTLAFLNLDQNGTLWYGTRVMTWVYPSAFHCYYAGKETYISFYTYTTQTTLKYIFYNLVYKTGNMFD